LAISVDRYSLSCEEIEAETGIPVFNTKVIGIQFTEMLPGNPTSQSSIADTCRIQFSPGASRK
jgi:hypothetical protein